MEYLALCGRKSVAGATQAKKPPDPKGEGKEERMYTYIRNLPITESIMLSVMGSATFGDVAARLERASHAHAWLAEKRGVRSPYTAHAPQLIADDDQLVIGDWDAFLRLVAKESNLHLQDMACRWSSTLASLQDEARVRRQYNIRLLAPGEEPKYELQPLIEWLKRNLDRLERLIKDDSSGVSASEENVRETFESPYVEIISPPLEEGD